jgi:uncharacterized damage-inducible protein DinB
MEWIQKYKEGISLFEYSSKDLSPEDLLAKPGPGEWSSIEVFMHILDSDLAFSDRMKRVISEENPTLLKFDEKKYKERLCYQPMVLSSAINLFTSNREVTIFHLNHLKPIDFSRVGNHSIRGPQTLAQILEFSVWHLNHHLKFIYGKRENLGKKIEEKYSI